MDVNEHERLSNIILRHKLKCFYCCSAVHNHSRDINNEQNSYPKMSVKQPLVCSWLVLLPINAKSGHGNWYINLVKIDTTYHITINKKFMNYTTLELCPLKITKINLKKFLQQLGAHLLFNSEDNDLTLTYFSFKNF